MNHYLTIALAAVGFVAAELLIAIAIAKVLERGASKFDAYAELEWDDR